MLSSDTRPYLRHPWQYITVLDTSLLQHVILPYDTNSDTNIADVQSVPTPFLCIAYCITIVAFDIHFIYEYLCITSQGSFVWFVGVSPKCVIPLWSPWPWPFVTIRSIARHLIRYRHFLQQQYWPSRLSLAYGPSSIHNLVWCDQSFRNNSTYQ